MKGQISTDDDPAAADEAENNGLSTFGGVFTPSLLTILGLVLFLRLGTVTGDVGLIAMLAILGLSTLVSVLTTISLAAIATNLRVGGGGVYFLVSRTLGPAFGGSIGLVLYTAMSISIAFYAIGLGEAVASVVGSDSPSLPRLIAAVTILALLGLAWLGADIATRLQYLVMVFLVIAIGAYFIGVVPDLDAGRLGSSLGRPSAGGSFWVSFAIFFPAVTGFTQGVAMSGDLKTPSRSISVGTFAAIGVSTLVYLLVIITFVLAVPLSDLRGDASIMRNLAVSPWLIDVGVIAATLSSAIASMMGAPRTLQRLAADRLVTRLEPFAVGTGPDNNPRRGTVLSTAIALLTVALGDLDVVAPVISMFFLSSYGMINYATYSEARAASTSFRPTFRYFHWRASLAGTVACLVAILAIDPLAGGLAGCALVALYRYFSRNVDQVRWVDSSSGFHASNVRLHLERLGASSSHSRDFRPCTVAFAPRDPDRRERLATVASWIDGGSGFTTIARIVPGRGPVVRKHANQINFALQRELADNPATLYGRVIVADTIEAGIGATLQAHGIGALHANTAMFSWFANDDEDDKTNEHTALAQTAIRFGVNTAIVHAPDQAWNQIRERTAPNHIAVWWADDTSGQFLTLLAWMCTRTEQWQNATITVLVPSDHATTTKDLEGKLVDARITASVASADSARLLSEIVANVGLLLAPLRIRDGIALGPRDEPLDHTVDQLCASIFVNVAAPVDLDQQPDEGKATALALKQDRAIELSARAEELSTTAGRLLVDAELARMTERPLEEIVDADAAATAAQRTYVDAKSRADEAWRVVRDLDPTHTTGGVDPSLWLTGR